jgi:MoCo/4Fe-4S cofactor protein with predicted Tat translocation signal
MTPRQRLQALAQHGGRRFWRGLDELADDPVTREWLEAEFPAAFEFEFDRVGVDRRQVLKAMAASLVMASLSGCDDGPPNAVPYVEQPPSYVPGIARRFATAIPFEGYAQPVLAECHAGRPTRLDGNPQHPMSGGAVGSFTQAAVLELYDPDRSGTVTHRGRIAPWNVFDAAMLSEAARLKATGGGLRLLTGPIGSPTLLRQINALRRSFPGLRWHAYAPVGEERGAAARLAFGRPLQVWPRLDRARVVVCLEDDPLGAGPMQVATARAWASQRARGDGYPLLFVAESTPTLTGAQAHGRLAVASARIPLLIAALGGATVELAEVERDWLAAVIAAVKRHPGEAAVGVGGHHSAETQAAGMLLGYRLGRPGITTSYTAPIIAEPDQGLPELVADMAAGRVETLVMIDVNPCYAAPGGLDFTAALARVPFSVHAGERSDETASYSQWHLPLAHPLESWSDARAVDGSATILQPLIAPMHQGRTAHQILAGLLGQPGAEAQSLVRDTWRELDDTAWRRALHDGFVAGSAAAPVPVTPRPLPPHLPKAGSGGIEVVFRPDPTVWDGRFANCGWLQELPKPLTKVVWDNIVAVSPQLGSRLGLHTGALVEVEVGGRRLQGPVWLLPGQAENTVTLALGHGRRRGGRVAEGVGYDAYPLQPVQAAWSSAGLRKLDGTAALATTQQHHAIDGDGLVRVVAPHAGVEGAASTAIGHADRPSLYPRRDPGEPAWGMVIDLDLCIGCNACITACQAENNIPVVGKGQVAQGREMHWLRVDRYYEGPPETPFTHFQPIPCMHCENAPCELGCPVNATVHGPGGINEMTYNRCIGTRTCATYCPYKVRRFNFFDYGRGARPPEQAQRNPEVTVRTRGVMEKCTYCIQRIETAGIAAAKQQRPLRDGEVRTACQTACPTGAIVFGNLADKASRVSRWQRDRRTYGLLDDLNTWPRTTYRARIRVPGAKEGG